MDVRTLLIVLVTVSLALGALMLVWWTLHRSMPGFGAVTAGVAGLALSVLGIALRGAIPDFISIVAANAVLALAPILFWNGFRVFNGKPALWRRPALALGAFVGAFLWFTYAENSIAVRIVLIAAWVAAGGILCAWELLRSAPAKLRTAAWACAASFGLIAAANLARLFDLWLSAAAPSLFAPSAGQAVYHLAAVITTVLVVFTTVLLYSERLRRTVEERGEELALLAEQRDRARLRAEQASRAKSEFLSHMSHELRTPLNAVLGFAQILESNSRHPLADVQRAHVREIVGGGRHLLALIDDIFDLTRVETGKLNLSPEDVDAHALLADCLGAVAPQAGQAAVALRAPAAPSAPCRVRADRLRLKQALLNLLSNAIKYNLPQGSVSARIEAAPQGRIRIAVEDSGRGIALERQNELFTPFARLGAENSAVEGLGIGLVITRQFVEAMGGSLGFVSAPGKGSTFWIELPAA